jgi:hypothetical protein
MKERPWIWVIIGFVLFVAALAHFVSICIRNPQPSVPLTTSHER